MLSRWTDWDALWEADFPREFERGFRTLDELRQEMDRVFKGYERGLGGLARPFGAFSGPQISLSDTGANLELRAELPGLAENDVDVSVNAQTLTLRGERKADAPEGYSVHRKERQSYKFERSYQLPCKVDPEKALATMKHGVLTLTLPKAAEAQPKQISVRAG